jgi:carboxypeptidase Taq
MSNKTKDFTDELYDLTKEISTLSSCTAVLDWDERTYMPSRGSENRSNQVALLAGMAHEKLTSPRIGELINEL